MFVIKLWFECNGCSPSSYAVFTLNSFDYQERNLTFVKRKQISKFHNPNFMPAILSRLSILFLISINVM